MFAAAEHQNCNDAFLSINEEHKQKLKSKINSIEQEEAYYRDRELLFHWDKDSTRSFIQAVGRIRMKQTMDYFKVNTWYTGN